MQMEEEDEELSGFNEDVQIDFRYEFDAVHFFDFTRPETASEAVEAEHWFDDASGYSPSPYIIKFNWKEGLMEVSSNTSTTSVDENSKDQHSPKVKEKSASKSSALRGSTLMKPTASHLAKLNLWGGTDSTYVLRRSRWRYAGTDEKSAQSPLVAESHASKRQKLEIGFLRKISQMKHQTVYAHKVSVKVGQVDMKSTGPKPRVTVPREPDLKTSLRAQLRRSRHKYIAESGDSIKTSANGFKARPLNRKILEAPKLTSPKKGVPRSKEFQETKESTTNHMCKVEVMDAKRPNSGRALKHEEPEGLRPPYRYMTVGSQLPDDKSISHIPPIELFSKLSLRSETEHTEVPKPKSSTTTRGSKENAPAPFHQEHEMINGIIKKKKKMMKMFERKPNRQKSKDGLIIENGDRPNVNRYQQQHIHANNSI